LLFLQFR